MISDFIKKGQETVLFVISKEISSYRIYTRKYFALLVSIKPDGMGCDSLKYECCIEFYALEFTFRDFYRLVTGS